MLTVACTMLVRQLKPGPKLLPASIRPTSTAAAQQAISWDRTGCRRCRAQRGLVVTAALINGHYVGDLTATGMRIGIVIGRFNEIVTRSLLDGALEAFQRHGCSRNDIEVSNGTCRLGRHAGRQAGW